MSLCIDGRYDFTETCRGDGAAGFLSLDTNFLSQFCETEVRMLYGSSTNTNLNASRLKLIV